MRLVDSCPACASASFGRQVTIDNEERASRFRKFSQLKYGGLFDDWVDELQPEIVSCGACGHHWYRRQPSAEQLSLMYANGRPLQNATVSREPSAEMLVEMKRLRQLSRKQAPTLLDFGSGFGRWARAAARAGFDVHAYEPSQARGAESVDEFQLVHDLSEIEGMRFDVINLEQVLEHVPDPLQTLEQIKAYFAGGTILRVRVPNIARPPEGAAVWQDWPHDGTTRVHIMAPFEHLHGFTPASLKALARRAGFDVVSGWRLARSYPVNWLRDAAEPLRPGWGSTFALLTIPDRRLGNSPS